MHKLSGNFVCTENKEAKVTVLQNNLAMKNVHFLLKNLPLKI